MKNSILPLLLPRVIGYSSFIACTLALGSFAEAQTTYSWNTTGTANWSTAADWSAVSGTGTTYPGASDTAILGNVTSGTREIVYDSSASGTIGALTITQTSNAFNLLDIQKSLTVSNAIILGATSGTASLRIDKTSASTLVNLTLSNGISITSGGLLEWSSYQTSSSSVGTITGNVAVNSGGVFQIDRGYWTTGSSTTVNYTIAGDVTNSGGLITIGAMNSTSGGNSTDTRLNIYGNFTMTGGTISVSNGGGLYLDGSSSIISGGVVNANIYMIGESAPTPVYNQTLKSDATLQLVVCRASSTTASVSSTFTLGAYTTGGTLKLSQISLYSQSPGGTLTLNLSSNVTSSYNGSNVFFFQAPSSGTGNYIVNLDGYTMDLTSYTGVWTGPVSGTARVGLSITGGGTFKASGINLSSTNYDSISIGAGVTLQASGSGLANVLSAGGNIDPTSTFLYTGTGTSTLASNRNIGNLTVSGTSGNTGRLTLASAITAAGTVLVDGSSTLDTSSYVLTAGGGLVLGSSTASALITGTGGVVLTSTSGGAVTATVVSGTINSAISSGTAASSLLKTGNSTTVVLNGSNSYLGATTISAGQLDVNGSLAAASAVSIASGATLGGSGTVGGTVTATSATINGNGLTMGATTLYGTSTLKGYNIASSVTVANGGSTTLTGTTKVTSGLSVSAGATLNANGTIDGNATVSGLLKGNSTIAGSLSLTSGTLSTGNSAGITTVGGNFTMDSSSTLVAEVTGTVAGTSYDQLKVSGNVTLAGTLDLSTLSGLTLGETITLIDNTGSGTTTEYFTTIVTSSGTYTVTSNSDYTFTSGSTEYLLSYNTNSSSSSYGDVTLTVVPEPSTWAMIVGGMGLLTFGQRLRRRDMK
jgi:fibronectin-binding autotransporter adhesin